MASQDLDQSADAASASPAAHDPLAILHGVRRWILNHAAEAGCYRSSWGDSFAAKEVQKAWSLSGEETLPRLTVAEVRSLGDAELKGLGFRMWDEDGPMLIPLWAWNVIADGEVLTSISGDTQVKGVDDIDLDVRFGCIAFGFPLTPDGGEAVRTEAPGEDSRDAKNPIPNPTGEEK